MNFTSRSTRARLTAIAGVLALFGSIQAGAGPRDDVKGIAALIEQNYFDPQRGAAIAAELERDANAGRFDALQDRNELTVALSRRLIKLDRHFNVSWDPNRDPNAPVRTPGGPPLREARQPAERRANFGFRRVERLPGNLAYIELTYVANIDFEDDEDPARQAADAALALARGADGVILDLRNNGGGAPSMVGYLVSAFVAPKSDIYNTFYSRAGTQSERAETEYSNPMLTVPLYVLTSTRTGSAAEAISFTLQSCGRATTVGEHSAGAANPGRVFTSREGLDVFISTGSPRNPINGRNWEGAGVQPDVAVPSALALARAQELALDKALANLAAGPERIDAQWARDALRVSAKPYAVKNLAGFAGGYGPMRVALSAGRLVINREGQLPVALVALQDDLFHLEGDPGRRVAFERVKGTPAGAITGLELRSPNGDVRKLRRVAIAPSVER